MYFFPAIRGKGLVKKLALMAMEQAREMGFKRCYLETTALAEAIALYEHLGFEHISTMRLAARVMLIVKCECWLQL